ncbi:MAG: gamma subclass chorismate mutase AroQ, partial [Planctomycetaceae bacterium]|nr:gamma subclass chorismate mutase AroQ [Planctomycetaceae bacterium]
MKPFPSGSSRQQPDIGTRGRLGFSIGSLLAVCLVWSAAGCGQELTETGTLSPAAEHSVEPGGGAETSVAERGPSPESAEQQVRQLVELLRQRLDLMPAVARWKWAERKPVSDPEREQQLLARLVAEGERAGLDPARLQPFFTAQFAASRERQQELFDRWEQADGPDPETETPDLINVLRPQITRLSSEVLAALVAIDGMAAARPEEVRNELLQVARAPVEPPDAAWQHVLSSL